jgi:hypothetical protein
VIFAASQFRAMLSATGRKESTNMEASVLKKFRLGPLSTAAAAVLLALTACAVQKPFRFAPKSISRISYNPKNCSQMMDGTFRCRDVIFTVTAVEIPPTK